METPPCPNCGRLMEAYTMYNEGWTGWACWGCLMLRPDPGVVRAVP